MFLQNLICSQVCDTRQFFEKQTCVTSEFYGCKDSNFNNNPRLIQSIVYIRLLPPGCFENKLVMNW